MSDLSSLLSRVLAADGPDRELDADLALCFDDIGNSSGFWQWRSAQPKGYDGQPREFALKRAPAYTASLDAALALVERVRPDAAPVEITNLFLYALVQVHKWRDEGQADPVSRLMPLALLAALIKSKMEMENEKDSDDV